MKQNHLAELSIRLFQAGDERTFNVVYDAYRKAIYLYVFKVVKNYADAMDITAKAFFQLWVKRGDMQDVSHVKNFLYHAALRACIDRLRRRRADSKRYDPVADDGSLPMKLAGGEHMTRQELLESEIVEEALMVDIRAEIEKLPRRCREICELLYLENKSVEEILEIMKIKKSTFYNQRMNAIIRIRMALHKKGYERVPLYLVLILSLLYN